MKDLDIVNLYWDRNEDAIHQTQMKYGSYLAKVAYNILADYEDSQECVNDTYLAAWHSMPTNRPNNLATYLGKIIRQISIDVFRKKHREKRIILKIIYVVRNYVKNVDLKIDLSR